ncbi:MAG: hypothetical protein JNK46_02215 [Methylobacteriaceae bacterium]|nr:hypothetical protein [Methylobacteriaceae bacterium]
MSNRLLASALSVAALVLASPAAFAQMVTIQNHVITNPQGGTVTFPKIEVTNTNLSREQVVKIFTPDTTKEERTALLKSMKADRFAIPTIQIQGPKARGAFNNFVATDINAGKLGKATLDSFDVAGTDKSDKPISMKSGAIAIENGDFSTVATAIATGDTAGLQPRVGVFKWTGFDLSIVEDGPKERTGPIRIAVGSIDMTNVFDGELFKSGVFAVKNLVIEPGKGSKLSRDLSPFGYDKLDLGMTMTSAYDAAKKALTVDDWTISGASAGALTLKAAMGSLEKGAFAPDQNAQLAALLGADISRLEIKFANAGLFEKAVAFVAQQQKKQPDALRKEWGAMAGQFLPAVLGGDPSALAIAGEAQKFVAEPKSLTLVATGKSGPVKLIDLASIKDPAGFLQKVKVEAAANR